MFNKYYIRKFRFWKETQESLPCFITAKKRKNTVKYYVKFLGFSKAVNSLKEATYFLDRLLNSDLSVINIKDIVINRYIDKTNNEMVIVVKGIGYDDDYIYIEKINKNIDLNYQYEVFKEACFISWKISFIREIEIKIFPLAIKNIIGIRRKK